MAAAAAMALQEKVNAAAATARLLCVQSDAPLFTDARPTPGEGDAPLLHAGVTQVYVILDASKCGFFTTAPTAEQRELLGTELRHHRADGMGAGILNGISPLIMSSALALCVANGVRATFGGEILSADEAHARAAADLAIGQISLVELALEHEQYERVCALDAQVRVLAAAGGVRLADTPRGGAGTVDPSQAAAAVVGAAAKAAAAAAAASAADAVAASASAAGAVAAVTAAADAEAAVDAAAAAAAAASRPLLSALDGLLDEVDSLLKCSSGVLVYQAGGVDIDDRDLVFMDTVESQSQSSERSQRRRDGAVKLKPPKRSRAASTADHAAEYFTRTGASGGVFESDHLATQIFESLALPDNTTIGSDPNADCAVFHAPADTASGLSEIRVSYIQSDPGKNRQIWTARGEKRTVKCNGAIEPRLWKCAGLAPDLRLAPPLSHLAAHRTRPIWIGSIRRSAAVTSPARTRSATCARTIGVLR